MSEMGPKRALHREKDGRQESGLCEKAGAFQKQPLT